MKVRGGAIGFDMDGVLAGFTRGYGNLIQEVSGRNLWEPGDFTDPPVWDWDKLRGYTNAERSATWERIMGSSRFWRDLPPLPGAFDLANRLRDIVRYQDVYFITSRVGYTAKSQTEKWLYEHVGTHMDSNWWPTVLIVGQHAKGDVAKSLKLVAYVDDYIENVRDVLLKSPTTRMYCYDVAHNRNESLTVVGDAAVGEIRQAFRVKGIDTMLSIESQLQ